MSENLKPYSKTYYEENKDKILERNKEWRGKNPEKCREYAKERYHNGGKTYQAQYRKQHREVYRKSHSKWREKNLEYDRQRQKEYRDKNREKERLRKKKYRAEQKLKYGIPDRHGGKTQSLLRGILEELTGFKAQEEVSFDWCRSEKGYIMLVDIFIPGLNLIVEYNGIQHYKPTRFGGSKVTMTECWRKCVSQRKRDKLKYKLIKENGFNLLVVPYWENVSKKNVSKLLEEVVLCQNEEEVSNILETEGLK